MNGIRAVPVDPDAEPRYDAYVASHPRATLYQRSVWARILRDSYRFQPRYLALADDAGEFHGVLPLVYKKGLVSSARIRSLPVFQWGGPLADTHDQEVMLVQAAREVAVGAECVLQILSARDYSAQLPELVTDRLPPRWVVRVDGDLDALRAGWRKTSNNLFRSLKKADKAGLVFREGTSKRDLSRFYRLYLLTMRKHRSLPRSRRELERTRDLLQRGEWRLFVVESGGQIAAGGIFHVFGSTVELIYNGSDERLLDLRPNHALYWNVMRWAASQGQGAFDLGRARPETPLGRFKSQWADPLPNYRYTWRPGDAPSRAESMATASYALEEAGDTGLVARAWQRAPLQLTRLGAALAYRYL
jgi:hypothetical protein